MGIRFRAAITIYVMCCPQILVLMYSCSHAVSFNRALDVCKLTGAVLFCVGGTSMAVGLVLSAFAKNYSKEELYLQQKFKERLADLHATVGELSSRTRFSDRVGS